MRESAACAVALAALRRGLVSSAIVMKAPMVLAAGCAAATDGTHIDMPAISTDSRESLLLAIAVIFL